MLDTITECLPDRAQFLAALAATLAAGEGLTAVIVVRLRDHRALELDRGYARAEAAMEQLAGRLASCLRPRDRFARLAPDAFALVLPGLTSAAQPLLALSKLRRACELPMTGAGADFRPRLCCGWHATHDEPDAETLLRAADLALDHAFARNLDEASFADCPLDVAPPPLRLGADLEAALGDGLLDVRFAPVVDIAEGELWAAELVAAWPSAPWGTLDAATLATLAEARGLATPFTQWLLNNALRERAEWPPSLAGLVIVVGLPGGVLGDPLLPEVVERALRLWDGEAGRLVLGIDEAAVMGAPQQAGAHLANLRATGVRLALSGFGAGASSLSLLQTLPLDYLKVAPGFVARMARDGADRAVVQTIIDLAHNFGLAVIAEGVADDDTLDELTLMGCRYALGPAIAAAADAEDFGAWCAGADWTAPAAGA
ncbi:MAG: EAL domain-containing protein [Gammaproteobacteria bacterium]